jgi:hypothetical protein
MRDDDREWQDLAAAWRGSQPVPLAGLAERVRRRNRRAAAVLASEAVVSVAALGVLGWLLSTSPSPLWLVWIAFMATTTVALLAFSIRARAGTWRPERPGVQGLLELSSHQARASIRLARGGMLATLLFLAFTAGWATFETWQLHDPTAAEIQRRALVYGGVLLYCIGWWVGCRIWTRRKHDELTRLERARAELGAANGETALPGARRS